MRILFDQTDFSVVVENRALPPKPRRWEISGWAKEPNGMFIDLL
jgi:hypothetical protein